MFFVFSSMLKQTNIICPLNKIIIVNSNNKFSILKILNIRHKSFLTNVYLLYYTDLFDNNRLH